VAALCHGIVTPETNGPVQSSRTIRAGDGDRAVFGKRLGQGWLIVADI
jgi:hypothetical protein